MSERIEDKKDGRKEENRKLRCLLVTFGCQMNEYDTQVASGLLSHQGYSQAESEDEADVVIMNTCSVREHAEDRVFGRLGMLGKKKKEKPDLIIGLMGCMVEEHREKLFKRFPQLDFMVGTRNISELPSIIQEVSKNRKQVSKIKQDGISIEYSDLVERNSDFYAWLPIMTGCNKVCTYCIVPITRGIEVSMPAHEVYREASRLAGEGVKWITLLGQNVNSYNGTNQLSVGAGLPSPGRGDLAPTIHGRVGFPQLLEMLCEIEGLERISFTTSHPQDATEELFRVIAKNPKISRRFHLPLQSGSDRILKRMKRLHTYAEYKEKIDLMRSLIPDVSVTTDIIAGFSGEAEEDHQATIQALEEIRYDSAYIYKYSLRPATPAAKLPDDVPREIKSERNQELLEIQKKITIEQNRKSIGQILNAFVEKISTKAKKGTDNNSCLLPFLIGRTDHDKKLVFEGGPSLIGKFVQVRLDDTYHETLIGTLIS